MNKPTTSASPLQVNDNFIAGMDAGGSKVLAVDTISTNTHRFVAPDYPDLYAVLDEYFTAAKALPRRVVIAMAGPRDDETGDVHPTNIGWPIFSPAEAAKRFPGTEFVTIHDLAGPAAGVLQASSIDLLPLKSGTAKTNGPLITVAISTGVGVCASIRDGRSGRHVFFSGEAGHMGFQPYSEAERRHLDHLYTKFDHPSVELAINGKHGIGSWIECSPELAGAPELQAAISRAEAVNNPLGAVLLEFATAGQGADHDAAHAILANMGALVGNVLADFALAYRSTGGIYLTGSVALGLAEYWATHTEFAKAFTRHGTPDHASWKREFFENMPIYLITDPDIAAVGALSLAKDPDA